MLTSSSFCIHTHTHTHTTHIHHTTHAHAHHTHTRTHILIPFQYGGPMGLKVDTVTNPYPKVTKTRQQHSLCMISHQFTKTITQVFSVSHSVMKGNNCSWHRHVWVQTVLPWHSISWPLPKTFITSRRLYLMATSTGVSPSSFLGKGVARSSSKACSR